MDRLYSARPGRTADRDRQGRTAPASVVTAGPGDEGPSWAASSREILFQRSRPVRTGLYRVALDGSEPRPVAIPQDGSDPIGRE